MTRMLLLFVLIAALFSGCANIEAPPPQFTMHCDVCGRATVWRDAYPYFECAASGTRW